MTDGSVYISRYGFDQVQISLRASFVDHMCFPHAYIINLDGSDVRMAEMRAELDREGLSFTRVPGVDGRGRAAQSSRLGCPALACLNHDDDLLTYALFANGEMLPRSANSVGFNYLEDGVHPVGYAMDDFERVG